MGVVCASSSYEPYKGNILWFCRRFDINNIQTKFGQNKISRRICFSSLFLTKIRSEVGHKSAMFIKQ